jgi:glycosyltransferase involved in cell wall biosynthesis
MNPSISVITITYNDIYGFLRTANSIIPQLCPSVEWIVKDGGSPSHILKHIKKLISCTDCTFLSSRDGGVYDAMNQALALVNGKWIIFMNGGDKFYSDDTLLRTLSIISNLNLDPSSRHILGGGTELISESGRSSYSPARSISHCVGINCYRMPAFHQSQIYSRSICSEQRFRDELKVSADHAYFWEAISKGAHFSRLDISISCFYAGGLSSQKKLQSCLDVGYSIFVIQGQANLFGLLAIVKRLLASYLPRLGFKSFNI